MSWTELWLIITDSRKSLPFFYLNWTAISAWNEGIIKFIWSQLIQWTVPANVWRITRYPPKSALTFHTNQVVSWEPLARQRLCYLADLAAGNSHTTSFHHGNGAESVHTTSRLKHLKSGCASLSYFSPFCCLELFMRRVTLEEEPLKIAEPLSVWVPEWLRTAVSPVISQ